jgi:hypothetical protein
MPVERFGSEEKYRKYRAYVHIHGIPTHASKVCIRGKGCHTVRHGGKTRAGRKRLRSK